MTIKYVDRWLKEDTVINKIRYLLKIIVFEILFLWYYPQKSKKKTQKYYFNIIFNCK